jgi:hypothetical protein
MGWSHLRDWPTMMKKLTNTGTYGGNPRGCICTIPAEISAAITAFFRLTRV